MIDTTPLWPLRTSCTAASSSARSWIAADERDVGPHRPRAGRGGAGDEPRLLVLLPAPQAGDAERLAGDRRRAQGGRWRADEHAAGRGQRLQPRRRVHDVTHRGVVRAGEDADQDLAGVDADAHLDRRLAAGRRRRSRASVSCIRRPARTARSASSSWATGAPNRATMASPSSLSTRPPNSLDVGHQPLEAATRPGA